MAVFSRSRWRAARPWHIFLLLLCETTRDQKEWTQLSPEAATPCWSHSVFPHNITLNQSGNVALMRLPLDISTFQTWPGNYVLYLLWAYLCGWNLSNLSFCAATNCSEETNIRITYCRYNWLSCYDKTQPLKKGKAGVGNRVETSWSKLDFEIIQPKETPTLLG